jgi:hypothetical protein
MKIKPFAAVVTALILVVARLFVPVTRNGLNALVCERNASSRCSKPT